MCGADRRGHSVKSARHGGEGGIAFSRPKGSRERRSTEENVVGRGGVRRCRSAGGDAEERRTPPTDAPQTGKGGVLNLVLIFARESVKYI